MKNLIKKGIHFLMNFTMLSANPLFLFFFVSFCYIKDCLKVGGIPYPVLLVCRRGTIRVRLL